MADIIPKDLLELPYVDRAPNPEERPDQRRIDWIRNGECLGAAEHAADNGGELNRGPVKVQKNTETLLENDKILNTSLTEVITRVNAHDVVLGQIGDDNLATKVENLEQAVVPMAQGILENKQAIFLVEEDFKKINTSVGERPVADDTDRDVMNDLLYIKTEIGNFEGKDINGIDVAGNPATGIKARIISQGLGIASNERRIKTLEDDWMQSDVASIQAEMDQLRLEVGATPLKPVDKTVYQWIKDAETKHTEIDDKIDEINRVIGTGTGQTIDDRITENTTKIGENKVAIDSVKIDVDALKTAVGDDTTETSISYRLKTTEQTVATMETVVGKTENDGLRKSVADISAKVGTEAEATSVMGRMKAAETNINTNQRELSTLKNQVGSNTPGSETGLTARIRQVEIKVSGSGGAGGLSADVATLKTDITSKISDVSDNKKYIRTQGAWEELGSVMGVPEAPMDSKDYVRNQGQWKQANWAGVLVPADQKIEFNDSTGAGTNKTHLASYDATSETVTIGHTNKKLKLEGVLEPITTSATFELKDVSNVKYFSRSGDDVTIGSTSYQVKLISGTGSKQPAVVQGGSTYNIWHAGNFADNDTATPKVRVSGGWENLTSHLPPIVRTRGGHYVQNNTAITSLTKDMLSQFGISAPFQSFGFNTNITASLAEGVKYTGEADCVVNVVAQCELKLEDPTKPIELDIILMVDENQTTIKYKVRPNMWSDDGYAYAFVSFPYNLSPNNKLSLRPMLKGTEATSSIVLVSETVYVMEM